MKRVLRSVLVVFLAVPVVLCGAKGIGLKSSTASQITAPHYAKIGEKSGTPLEINYQGFLADSSTDTGITGKHNMIFRLYNAPTGGSALWTEEQDTIQVDKGIFNVLLGSINPLPASIFNGSALYLETRIESDTMSPRKKIVSVAYAIKSGKSDSARNTIYADTAAYAISALGGLTASQFLRSDVPDTGKYVSFDSVNVKYIYKIGGQGILSIPGSDNLCIGLDAGSNSNVGSCNIFSGIEAGYHNTTGSGNTFSGYGAGGNNTTGNNNTFSGYGTGWFNDSGSENTFSGSWAGYHNTTGNNNTFCGYSAGYYNTTGSYNAFYGFGAGDSNTSGYNNTFSGYYAGYHNSTGAANTFSGYQAGYHNNTGVSNTFYGVDAGYSNTIGNYNTFYGTSAGYHNTGGANTFSGFQAGYSNTGNENTFSGFYAGSSNTTGNDNTFCGIFAGTNNTAGSNNVYIGSGAGYTAGVNDSNRLYIANGQSSSNVLLYGNFATRQLGIGTTTTTHTIDVNGGAYCTGTNWVNGSSRAYKENIKELNTEEAEKAVNDLNPVTFNYKIDKTQNHCGFIAEDVPELVAMKDRKGLDAMDIVAVLTKVLQEQQKTVQEQEKTVQEQEKTVQKQQEEINLLKQEVEQLKNK